MGWVQFELRACDGRRNPRETPCIAPVATTSARGDTHRCPTFLNGYGHFDEVENDIAVSKDFAQTVIVEPGRSYDVSLWAKSDDAAGLSITAVGTDEGAVGQQWTRSLQR